MPFFCKNSNVNSQPMHYLCIVEREKMPCMARPLIPLVN